MEPSVVATLRGLTITGGYSVFAGAGIWNEGDLAIEDCRIVGNQSGDIAAGIWSFEGELRVTNSETSENEAREGAAIYAGGEVILRDSTISDNIGGGVESEGVLRVSGCTISGNVSEFGGGGVYGYDAFRSVEGDLDLIRLGLIDVQYSTIANNSAQRGGGIYSIVVRMTVWNSTLSGNAATEEGGALYIGGTTLGASTTYLTTNTIVDNSAPLGSAIVKRYPLFGDQDYKPPIRERRKVPAERSTR